MGWPFIKPYSTRVRFVFYPLPHNYFTFDVISRACVNRLAVSEATLRYCASPGFCLSTMADQLLATSLAPRELTLPCGKTLPPSIPLILSSHDNWNPLSCTLETSKQDPNNHSLKVVDDALKLLRTIDKPLTVLSICGPYRSGKSYFISRVLGSPGAFTLGHSMQACTRGIWMATTVLECQDYAIVLLDTEGIDAVGASETVAMSLLTLTTLLSSFLV